MIDRVEAGESGTIPSLEKLRLLPEYQNSTLLRKFSAQAKKVPNAAFVDLDGTLFIKTANQQPEDKYPQATAEFLRLIDQQHVPLVAVTGRDLELSIADNIPQPDFDVVCAAVGTEIWVRQKDGSYLLDEEYKKHIEQDIGFNREAVWQKAKELKDELQTQSPQLKVDFQPRDQAENTTGKPPQPYKISFSFEGSGEEAQIIREQFKKYYKDCGFEKVQVVVSQREVLESGIIRWNLDLVPVTKKEAIDFMADKYGCRGVVAGDSGNDEEMILKGGPNNLIAGAIVGNAKPELTKALEDCEIVRETKHFRIVRTPGNRLLYVEPDPSKAGPESLKRMFQAFSLFDRLREH